MTPEVMIALIGALFGAGGIAAILKTRADNKKTSAEAEVTLGGGWSVLVQTQRAEINELRERIAIVEKHEQECRSRLAHLEGKDSSPEAVERLVVALVDKKIKALEAH